MRRCESQAGKFQQRVRVHFANSYACSPTSSCNQGNLLQRVSSREPLICVIEARCQEYAQNNDPMKIMRCMQEEQNKRNGRKTWRSCESWLHQKSWDPRYKLDAWIGLWSLGCGPQGGSPCWPNHSGLVPRVLYWGELNFYSSHTTSLGFVEFGIWTCI